MYKAPSLCPYDLDYLVRICGGQKPAAKALGVTPAQLKRWLQVQTAPASCLKLLWYCSPGGRAAAEVDLHNELRLLAAERDALILDATRRSRHIDESAAAMKSEIEALEQENAELRRLLGAEKVRDEIERARDQLDRVLRALASTRRASSLGTLCHSEAANGASTATGSGPLDPSADVAILKRGHPAISLRSSLAEDAKFIYRVIEETMRVHVEATWGRWSPERVEQESREDSGSANFRDIPFTGSLPQLEPRSEVELDVG